MINMLFEGFGCCSETGNNIKSIFCKDRDSCRAPTRFTYSAQNETQALEGIRQLAKKYKCQANRELIFYSADQTIDF